MLFLLFFNFIFNRNKEIGDILILKNKKLKKIIDFYVIMVKQIITNGISEIQLTKDEALKLELEINLYNNRNFWIDVGDQLYEFHSQNINLPIQVDNIKFKSIEAVLKKLNISF